MPSIQCEITCWLSFHAFLLLFPPFSDVSCSFPKGDVYKKGKHSVWLIWLLVFHLWRTVGPQTAAFFPFIFLPRCLHHQLVYFSLSAQKNSLTIWCFLSWSLVKNDSVAPLCDLPVTPLFASLHLRCSYQQLSLSQRWKSTIYHDSSKRKIAGIKKENVRWLGVSGRVGRVGSTLCVCSCVCVCVCVPARANLVWCAFNLSNSVAQECRSADESFAPAHDCLS